MSLLAVVYCQLWKSQAGPEAQQVRDSGQAHRGTFTLCIEGDKELTSVDCLSALAPTPLSKGIKGISRVK